ncbi:MAG: rhomboid family intramembrane serine protease [Planctomycetes bacterium]|nr:rhomboid family intramembrane serine protease [Planctomycetota bacterium]
MFIPIGDENPTERKPFVNYALIGANVLAFLLFCLGPPDDPSLIRWTMIPGHLEWPTLFTSMFLHGGWLHLIGNMLFLWIFGDNVEDRLGHVGYTVFYVACGLAAGGAHIAFNSHSEIPTLGASGAISGVMGAYIVFFPHARVKTFIWLGVLYADVVRTPAWLWIGIWILQQVVFNALDRGGLGGGVAYLAHIGGFAAGAAVGGAIRLLMEYWPRTPPAERSPDTAPPKRRLFLPVAEDPGIEYMDEPGDGTSVLRLREDTNDVAKISEIVAAVTGESPFDVVDRLVVTHGLIARSIPRESAARIQRELHTFGIPSALILHSRANFPPAPAPVDSASWDSRALRLRAGDQVVPVPWTTPFLYVAARLEGQAFLDVFVNRKTAYRIPDARHIPLRQIDQDGRTEIPTDLAGLARAVMDRATVAVLNEGLRGGAAGDWGRLDFRTRRDYDDYVFWLYNLTLAKGQGT